MMNNAVTQAVGIGVSVVPVFFLVFDAWIRVMQIGPVQESLVQRGYPVGSAVTIGLVGLVCIAAALGPRARRGTLSNLNTSLDDYR